MKITFVNHASIIIESGSVRLITDPWFEGPILNNGWSLLVPTVMKYDDFANITHIWLSHEHPDHFNPRTLTSIPVEYREKITVLMQATIDHRMAEFCQHAGFKVDEFLGSKMLSDDVQITIKKQGLLDSWLAFYGEGKLVVNFNDCIFSSDDEFPTFTQDVDVLLSQFSYANWPGETALARSESAVDKLTQLMRRARKYQPKTIIPFASFAWFSHEENWQWNADSNSTEEIRIMLSKAGFRSTILFPGDEFCFQELSYSWINAISYQESKKTLPQYIYSNLSTSMAALYATWTGWRTRQPGAEVPDAIVFLKDHNLKVVISRDTFTFTKGTADIAMSSDSLLYALTYPWGGDTLYANGRFSTVEGGSLDNFFRLFRLELLAMNGVTDYMEGFRKKVKL